MDNIFEDLDQDPSEAAHTHLGEGYLNRALRGSNRFSNDIAEKHGLNWAAELGYMYRQRDGGGGKCWVHNTEVDLGIQWDLVDSDGWLGRGGGTYLLTCIWERRNFLGFGEAKGREAVERAARIVFPLGERT